jgi:hypothetical protein
MLKGDISNELPRRVIVVVDTFIDIDVKVKKQFKVIPVSKKVETFNRSTLSRLYVFSQRVGYTLELVSFSHTEEQLEALVDKLDKKGTNPFRYFTVYEAIDHLVQELPYRPEVVGVLDLPTRLLRYGHWGMDFSQL